VKTAIPVNTPKPKSISFVSVLSVPFTSWNELENVIGEFCPDWSHTHRSYIVQHLIRFLELKVLTEEFATNKLLAPTPLLAQAWRAVILDKQLHARVIRDIQDFHGRPHSTLRYTLHPKDLELCHGGNIQRLQRTQHLFQAYFGETMLSSVEDIDADLSVTDTSTITDGIWHFPKCGNADTTTGSQSNSKSSMTTKSKSRARSRSKQDAPKISFQSMCLDVVSDLLFVDEPSVATTVVVDEIEETIDGTTTDHDNDYDSLFTFDFLNTRHFLCRGANGSQCGTRSGLSVFSW